ncbi:MAG: hypothetical protein KAT46_05760, partial [Deltaproteobacteria bacterium]|nr:hypothetical protein [Deltaproteobacteria bacterium]
MKKVLTRLMLIVLTLCVLGFGFSSEAYAHGTNGTSITCSVDQILKFNGTDWVCANDGSAAEVATLQSQVAALEAKLTHLTVSGN